MKCDVCGHQIEIGQWPFCKGNKEDHLGPIGGFEEPLEGYVDWNITEEHPGVEITTRAQRRKIMYANGMEYRPKGRRPGSLAFFDMSK